MRSDLTSTSHCFNGSVKVHMFTLCVLLLKWCLVTVRIGSVIVYVHLKTVYVLREKILNTQFSHFKSETELFFMAYIAKRGRWWWWSHVWNQLLTFSGTIEFPGLGLINTISKAEFSLALQYKRAHSYSYCHSLSFAFKVERSSTLW